MRMLAGFRSRCKSARRCAYWTARATFATSRAAARGSSGKSSTRCARLPPSISLMLKIVPPLVLTDLVDRHDVGVVERGDNFRLEPEPPHVVE